MSSTTELEFAKELAIEAGGIVTDMDGKKRRFDQNGLTTVMPANKAIHEKMLDLLKEL